MSARIAIHGLTKRYGETDAVRDLTLEIAEGSVFGLLGPNGAGKTTTFRCMLGFAHPTSGEVRYDGAPLDPALFERLAYVPDQSALYEWMTVAQHVELSRRSFRSFDGPRSRELLDRFSIDPRKKVKTLSKGQRTAVAVTLAFAIRPEMLILDEPASGLDPIHQRDVLDLIIEAAAGGATILFSSHQITQVERAADYIAILNRGRLVLTGEVDALKNERKIVEATFDRLPATPLGPNGVPFGRVETVGRTVRVHTVGESSAVADRLTALGSTSVAVIDQNLEDIFLDAVAGAKGNG